MTKIALYSDLHTEFGNSFPEVPEGVEVIVLAGDDVVGLGNGSLKEFCIIHSGKQIVMVAGNHNYYGGEFHTVNLSYQSLGVELGNFHFLNNSTFKYKNLVFHGCTLWTDFSCKGEAWKSIGMAEAHRGISDFYRIRYGDRRITPTDMSDLHAESLEWLSRSLTEHPEGVNVVVTHFPPLIECKHPHIPEGILDTYFNNDLGGLVAGSDVKWWFYGHNHSSDDFTLYDTRFVSNQMGYPREKTGWDTGLTFTL